MSLEEKQSILACGAGASTKIVFPAENRIERVENGVLYPWADRIKEGYSVKEIRPIKKDLFSKPVIKKKLLLEADYRKLL